MLAVKFHWLLETDALPGSQSGYRLDPMDCQYFTPIKCDLGLPSNQQAKTKAEAAVVDLDLREIVSLAQAELALASSRYAEHN